MCRANVGVLPLAVLISMHPIYASGENLMSFSKICKKESSSNAEYKNCRASKFAQQAASIKGQTGVSCNTERCIYKLKTYGGDWGRWEGEGYTLSFNGGPEAEAILGPEGDMWAIVISDPKKNISVFSTCGTCSDIDYVRGPIKRAATVNISEKYRLLAIPNK